MYWHKDSTEKQEEGQCPGATANNKNKLETPETNSNDT